jgi:hypothetical protein
MAALIRSILANAVIECIYDGMPAIPFATSGSAIISSTTAVAAAIAFNA